jgi:hypothetical protein
MPLPTSIRILENDNYRIGDLFTRLMADLFIALGYERPRVNIHKAGRELDLFAVHRLEARTAIGECKATAYPIGGADINKFVGALDAERKGIAPVTGYFVSLAGFRETAIAQENRGRRTRVILLTGAQVVDELINGRIVIPMERATELAGRCCSAAAGLILDSRTELLAHERGWIWAIYYTSGKMRTHFALIHSDGTPLAPSLTEEIRAADAQCDGDLHRLICVNPNPPNVAYDQMAYAQATAAYAQYIESECGYIQLDGLPADADVGSQKLRLENLFVPLHLDVKLWSDSRELKRKSVGAVLEEHPRLALLAAPGGGKSTLIKRLAVAYAHPSRSGRIADSLPARDWLPLFFRCRELRGLARGSFSEMLNVLSQREPIRQHAAAFRSQVDRALIDGNVLLLVDGLDEISDLGDRASFVCMLRAALQAYPDTAIVITSREAGFRHVAAHLASVCTHAKLSPFNGDDIRHLSVAWHRQIVSDTEKVRIDAEELAAAIAKNDRIRSLAVNPLLLTTLLLVKRWVGSLPTRRAVLYGKAVELLLMTWNTEGHEPIPEEEALPQLCYVAAAMMLGGVQKLSRPKLAAVLEAARSALPTELGYVRGTVDEFIHRVEDRSSLLTMTGYDVEDGQLIEFFEFRHLTFQEFLTARAMVKGWHPGRKDEDTLVSVLEPHFEKEEWHEVIPLSAVLGGKETEALIQRLTRNIATSGGSEAEILNLASCLADEAAARPETIRAAVRSLVRRGSYLSRSPVVESLVRGRYGDDFRDEARKAFMSGADLENTGDALLAAVWWQTLRNGGKNAYLLAVSQFRDMLTEPNELSRCEGASGIARVCELFLGRTFLKSGPLREIVRGSAPAIVAMLEGTALEAYSAALALITIGASRVFLPLPDSPIIRNLVKLWHGSSHEAVRLMAARALSALPLLPRDSHHVPIAVADFESILPCYPLADPIEQATILIAAWYLRALDDAALAALVLSWLGDMRRPSTSVPTLKDLLKKLSGLKVREVVRPEDPPRRSGKRGPRV